MRSMRVPLFDLKQVQSVTILVKLKVSFRSNKWLDESEVGRSKYLYSNLLLRVSCHIYDIKLSFREVWRTVSK